MDLLQSKMPTGLELWAAQDTGKLWGRSAFASSHSHVCFLQFFLDLENANVLSFQTRFLICPNLYMHIRTENSRDDQLVLLEKLSHTGQALCLLSDCKSSQVKIEDDCSHQTLGLSTLSFLSQSVSVSLISLLPKQPSQVVSCHLLCVCWYL